MASSDGFVDRVPGPGSEVGVGIGVAVDVLNGVGVNVGFWVEVGWVVVVEVGEIMG